MGGHRARAATVAALMLGSVLALAALPDVPVATATTGNGFGCDIDAQKPSVSDGEVMGHAAIACAWGMAGRTVRVEVWQKDGDGTWQPLSESVTDWLGMERPNLDLQIDGTGFWCKKAGGNDRTYQTRVYVGDGSGREKLTVSPAQKLSRDCLAASAAVNPHRPDPEPSDSTP